MILVPEGSAPPTLKEFPDALDNAKELSKETREQAAKTDAVQSLNFWQVQNMTQSLPPESIAAIATIIAALIAAAISFVNLTLTKEQKTSEFRQAWIDALREDMASFFATMRAFARASQEFQHFGGGKEGAPLSFSEQTISELRYRIAETKYRIQLRLNLKEPEHVELLWLMQTAIDKQQAALANPATTEDALQALEAAASFAPHILKSEWERVKKGELAFRLARNWFAPLTFGLSLLLIVLLWLGKVHL